MPTYPPSDAPQTLHYDQLLHHLRSIFTNNLTAQELYLDLAKTPKKIPFARIRHIYRILTEGKAAEVIYLKDRPSLSNFSQTQLNYAQRTCWRLIEHLLSKINYFLLNERSLNLLAPSILKSISFTRQAAAHLSHVKKLKSDFFLEVLDALVEENALLEHKVYEVLIEKGYIYSIDQFYRINGFQAPQTDFLRSENHQVIESTQKKIADENSSVLRTPKKAHTRQNGFVTDSRKTGNSRSPGSESKQDESFDVSSEISEMKPEILNRVTHSIRQQLDRALEEVGQLEVVDEQGEVEYALQRESQEKAGEFREFKNQVHKREPVVRQLVRNLRLKNYKANEKLIVINKKWSDQDKEDFSRKNQAKKTIKDNLRGSQILNRTSIVTVMGKRMREKVFQNANISDFEDLIVENLGRIEKNIVSEKKLQKRMKIRARQSQDIMDLRTRQEESSTDPHQFLSKILILGQQRGQKIIRGASGKGSVRMNLNESLEVKKIIEAKRISQISQDMGLQSNLYLPGPATNTSRFVLTRKQREKLINAANQSASDKQFRVKKQKYLKMRPQDFNPAILKIAARKYNRYSTEGTETMKFDPLQISSLLNEGTKTTLEVFLRKKKSPPYQHTCKFETYDRTKRRLI